MRKLKHKDPGHKKAIAPAKLEATMGVPALGMAGTSLGGLGSLEALVRTPHGLRPSRKGEQR